jgi:ferredoxin-NADP reductase
MQKPSKFELTFLRKEKESKDAYTFYFKHVKNNSSEKVDFKPGQYLKLFLEFKNPDNRGSSRYFTISSSPNEKNFITITTRIIKSSFKIKLNSLKSGEKKQAFGPIGYFDFDAKSRMNSVFLTGGMGITPVHSILNTINLKTFKSKIILISSFSNMEDVVFYDEFKKIEMKSNNVKIIYTLTKDKIMYSDFEKGRITGNMIKKYVQDYEKPKFFITGPEEFVNDAFDLVKSLGIPEENIFKEDFPGY